MSTATKTTKKEVVGPKDSDDPRLVEIYRQMLCKARTFQISVYGINAEDLETGDKFRMYWNRSQTFWEVLAKTVNNGKVFLTLQSTRSGMIKNKSFEVGQVIGNWRHDSHASNS